MISIKKDPIPKSNGNRPRYAMDPGYITVYRHPNGQGRRREDARKKLMKDHNIPLDRAVPHKKLPRQAAEQLGSLLKA
ncbi:hypothetical protein [Bacillus siamensis]|uniref:hypothetical protein n=1 Tax=Bacillus TaxID=1386 RepID=UPI0005F943CD|nr:hypothetical protein [Bacillus siamensis]